jgi:RNA polymerase sigma-70 factor (ECF subfamily)
VYRLYRHELMAIPQPDPERLRRARRGDPEAFRQLMATYQAPIYNYVLRLVGGDAALAEDLCQEIFMKVHQGLAGFNMQCRFTTWLFQIAKYRVLDELRARERRVQTPIELDRVPPAAIAAAPEVGFEQMDAVFRAIGELNTDMRAALLLRDVVGLSYNEIAEALEISLATTKWRIFKARELTAARLVAEGVLTPPSTTTSLAS